MTLRFVYQVVVPKALAPKELVKVFESGDRVVLPPWDPMVRMVPGYSDYFLTDSLCRVRWRKTRTQFHTSAADEFSMIFFELFAVTLLDWCSVYLSYS